VVGFSYQLGILISSPVDSIEARIGEHFPLDPIVKGGVSTKRYDYGQVMAIFIGCAYIYTIIVAAIGPENKGETCSSWMNSSWIISTMFQRNRYSDPRTSSL
jgi:hypothetical protein